MVVCVSFCVFPHVQLARGHRILILEVMEKICKEHIAKVPQQLGEDLVALSSRELTMSSVRLFLPLLLVISLSFVLIDLVIASFISPLCAHRFGCYTLHQSFFMCSLIWLLHSSSNLLYVLIDLVMGTVNVYVVLVMDTRTK